VTVSGSIGTEAIRGSISRKNSRNGRVPNADPNPIRNDVRVVPNARIARWARAPATAPQAEATIPKRLAKSTVPTMMPVV
jgi:hypothetical protein